MKKSEIFKISVGIIFIVISMFILLTVMGFPAIFRYCWKEDMAMVPTHVSLDTAKYKILKEDSLTINDMKIKRVYYLVKK